jgi:ABC-type sugar transport system ATPase subunit
MRGEIKHSQKDLGITPIYVTHDVHIGEIGILVLVDPARDIRVGDRITLAFDARKVQFFDKQSGHSLLWR